MYLLARIGVTLTFLSCTAAFGNLVEDFEDVSDWQVIIGSGAETGTLTRSSAEAQIGTYAGEVNYSLTTSQSFDYVRIYRDSLNVPLGGTDVFRFHLNQPNDPDGYLSLRLITDAGGYYFHDFSEGDGTWGIQSFIVGTEMGTSGSIGTTLTAVQLDMIGDGSATASSGTYFVDQMEVIPEPSVLTLTGLGALILLYRRRL
ncbi:MAG: PEP-CTERM sorting domain-containing protein [Verrucomicrobia bacterium]|nr:PEP-CTERM sorting domain-containing protein [Verrucomicrobiota bacterium]